VVKVTVSSQINIKHNAQNASFKDTVFTAQKIFHLGYKNELVNAVSGTSSCLVSDKHKTQSSDSLIKRPSSYRAVNNFHLVYKNSQIMM
jgi:hypothetical protein